MRDKLGSFDRGFKRTRPASALADMGLVLCLYLLWIEKNADTDLCICYNEKEIK